MRIVFAHTDFRIYWPARMKALNSFLTARGISFEVVEIAGGGSPYSFEKKNNLRPSYWHCIFPDRSMEKIKSIEANIALRNKLDELNPDIVFAGAIAFPSGAGAVRWAVENKKRVVIFDNARLQDVPRTRITNFIKKQVYKNVDAVLCPAQAWNRTFNYFGFDNNQIFHGLNVVDNEFWSNGSKNDRKEALGQYFLSIGRQVEKKNFLFLLKSYKQYCIKSDSPSPLCLVGSGPERKSLEEYVEKHNLKKVRFLQFASQAELKNIYGNAKCFILPSKYGETWGLVVSEAMASGLPVLVSDQVGCASTLVKNGYNGFTFATDKLNGLADLMLKIDRLPADELSKMGAGSLDIINDWGLERFCAGVSEAVDYVNQRDIKKSDPLSMILIKLWKGRYRPT